MTYVKVKDHSIVEDMNHGQSSFSMVKSDKDGDHSWNYSVARAIM